MLSSGKAKMTSKVKNTEIKIQQDASMDEIDEWAANNLDAEVIDNAVESSRKIQDAVKKKREKYFAAHRSDGALMIKSRDGGVFVLHAPHATQTCKGVERMVELQRTFPDAFYYTPVQMRLNCCAYVLDRIVHFWLFKIIDIGKIKKLEHSRWDPPKMSDTDVTDSMTTVGVLLEFFNTVTYHQDELASRASLAKLRAHLVSDLVTDEEIFEGLKHAYERCDANPTCHGAKVLKRVLLSKLVRGGADLTIGMNAQRFKDLVATYPDLAIDFSRGLLYYYQVYGRKLKGEVREVSNWAGSCRYWVE